ncbi:glycoside hydrolase family 108 protein [Persicobacter diffluens]|uniref:Secretion activator protein n=1 Tax=Persicobacter diffluens TaxID=981 RepID=A0AAN5AMD8_9BACT|nr:hypothetical protein PEDI_55120 [Persicobacter diffluens]
MTFNKILDQSLKHEGFYAHVPGDSGGETYQGIARNHHPNWVGWYHVDMAKGQAGGRLPWNHRIESTELDHLVREFYFEKFWKRARLDYIQDTALQAQIFDFYINAGGNAIKVLQRVLNQHFGMKLQVDGAIGPATISGVNSVDAQALFNRFKLARVEYYEALADSNAGLRKFLKGWKKRATDFVYAEWQPFGLGVIALVLIGGYLFYHYGKFSI